MTSKNEWNCFKRLLLWFLPLYYKYFMWIKQLNMNHRINFLYWEYKDNNVSSIEKTTRVIRDPSERRHCGNGGTMYCVGFCLSLNVVDVAAVGSQEVRRHISYK